MPRAGSVGPTPAWPDQTPSKGAESYKSFKKDLNKYSSYINETAEVIKEDPHLNLTDLTIVLSLLKGKLSDINLNQLPQSVAGHIRAATRDLDNAMSMVSEWKNNNTIPSNQQIEDYSEAAGSAASKLQEAEILLK